MMLRTDRLVKQPPAKQRLMLVSRLPWLWIFVALVVGSIAGAASTWIWTETHSQKKPLSIESRFALAGKHFKGDHYELAAEIMLPIAEAGNTNAQVNLAIALDLMGTRELLSKDKESGQADLDEPLKWWCLAALQQDAEAQNRVGWRRYNKDKAEAVYWWRHAADNGNPHAEETLAWYYHFGTDGFVRDDKKALQLLRSAAEKGHDGAQLTLAGIYLDGKGNSDPPWTQARQDYSEAAKWYLAAAEHGVAIAQEQVGLMYYGGIGVDRDYSQAYFWLSLAISEEMNRKEDIARRVKRRDEVASHLTKDRLNRAGFGIFDRTISGISA
jgi:TPR repeat protein